MYIPSINYDEVKGLSNILAGLNEVEPLSIGGSHKE